MTSVYTSAAFLAGRDHRHSRPPQIEEAVAIGGALLIGLALR